MADGLPVVVLVKLVLGVKEALLLLVPLSELLLVWLVEGETVGDPVTLGLRDSDTLSVGERDTRTLQLRVHDREVCGVELMLGVGVAVPLHEQVVDRENDGLRDGLGEWVGEAVTESVLLSDTVDWDAVGVRVVVDDKPGVGVLVAVEDVVELPMCDEEHVGGDREADAEGVRDRLTLRDTDPLRVEAVHEGLATLYDCVTVLVRLMTGVPELEWLCDPVSESVVVALVAVTLREKLPGVPVSEGVALSVHVEDAVLLWEGVPESTGVAEEESDAVPEGLVNEGVGDALSVTPLLNVQLGVVDRELVGERIIEDVPVGVLVRRFEREALLVRE